MLPVQVKFPVVTALLTKPGIKGRGKYNMILSRNGLFDGLLAVLGRGRRGGNSKLVAYLHIEGWAAGRKG